MGREKADISWSASRFRNADSKFFRVSTEAELYSTGIGQCRLSASVRRVLQSVNRLLDIHEKDETLHCKH